MRNTDCIPSSITLPVATIVVHEFNVSKHNKMVELGFVNTWKHKLHTCSSIVPVGLPLV